MTYVLLGLQALVLVVLWDVRRALGVRVRLPRWNAPAVSDPQDNGASRRFPGAIPPSRYVVVRWPDGHHFYSGCVGALARTVYEHLHPAPGEEVEFWELGDRRGHKAA